MSEEKKQPVPCSPFIDDGYTCFKAIERVPGIHEAYDFFYRPALNRTKTELQLAAGSGNIDKQEQSECSIIAAHTVQLGNLPAITADLAKKLKPQLRNAMLNCILGYVGSDEERADAKN
jgi:hypothetical protein